MVGLFGAKSKSKMAKFLSEFVQKLKELLFRSVVNINGKQYNLSVFCFVYDAPARALLKAIVPHTGYYCCERCTQRGIQKHKKNVFDDLEENVTLPNNDMFCNHSTPFQIPVGSSINTLIHVCFNCQLILYKILY